MKSRLLPGNSHLWAAPPQREMSEETNGETEEEYGISPGGRRGIQVATPCEFFAVTPTPSRDALVPQLSGQCSTP